METIDGGEAARLEALAAYDILDTAEDPVFDAVTDLAATICGTPIALISLVDDRRQWFLAHTGLALRETPREMAFCTHAIRQEGVYEVTDAAEAPAFAANPLVTGEPGIRFYAGMPLATPEGYRIGTLCVIGRRPGTLSPDQRTALARLATVVVRLLEERKRVKSALAEVAAANARLYEQATRDALTGALNRRHFFGLAELEDARLARGAAPYCVLYLDLDGFKGLNDRFGHKAGDAALLAVADACRARLRPSDLFARFGGDEFVALLPATTRIEARGIAERLRAALAETVVVAEAPDLRVRLSAGLAEGRPGVTFTQVLEAADQALYAAKRQGRDRLAEAPPP